MSTHTPHPFSKLCHVQSQILENVLKRLEKWNHHHSYNNLVTDWKIMSANKEMVVYYFDTLVAHYNSQQAPPPTFDEGQQGTNYFLRELVEWRCGIVKLGRHGMIIEFTDPDYKARRSATYLPEIAAHEGWTKIEAVDSLVRKAGYDGIITESLRKRIHLTCYHKTLFTMHYGEYVAYVKNSRGVTPTINGVKP